MRIGHNPNKDKNLDVSFYEHQVIVPVHIPNFEGYFKDSLTILKYCLESLFKTSHERTFFTIVNNGSCKEVQDYLNGLFEVNLLHELIITDSIGKLNAILKGLVGHNFPLVTIADADVMFLTGWQSKTVEVFNTFPKTGVVCPTPSSKSYKYFTQNILLELFLSKKLQFTKIINPAPLIKFGNSIGKKNFYNSFQLDRYLTVTDKEVAAVIGAGHFVATYDRTIFKILNNTYAKSKMGAKSETQFLDKPVFDLGLWRLSTSDSFAYHMGNIYEDWMAKEFIKLKSDIFIPLFTREKKHSRSVFNKLGVYFLIKCFELKIFRVAFFKYKGLTEEAALGYEKKLSS